MSMLSQELYIQQLLKELNSNRKIIPGQNLCCQHEKIMEVSKEVASNEEEYLDIHTYRRKRCID